MSKHQHDPWLTIAMLIITYLPTRIPCVWKRWLLSHYEVVP